MYDEGRVEASKKSTMIVQRRVGRDRKRATPKKARGSASDWGSGAVAVQEGAERANPKMSAKS